ncbi:aminotriazole resistance protein [Microthyrium microscopicum]|uniref:Aminotriazole resistance protein n=1 Tax=Microthyrium microscopicum TaxID=703497 RepID=A0A6A6UBS6_9PEZI|nr:aminotriazole resistance protein [Microthyrium microscopicum]
MALEKSKDVGVVPTSPTDLEDNHSITSIPKYGRPECFTSTSQEIFVVLTATMAVGLNSMTAGIVTVNSSFIGRDLGMTTAEITWLSAASSLASGSFLLLFARIADLFGRRYLFIGSLLIFSIFSLGAGFAKQGVTLDILTGFMGLMSAAAVPPAQGMLAVIYDSPSKRKNAVFACFSAGNPLGFVFGLISGGIVTNIFNWRAAFWWLAIIYFLFTVISVFVIPKDTEERVKLDKGTFKRLDALGSLLVIIGTGLFSAALSMGSDAGWGTGYVIVLLVLGLFFMTIFVFWELYVEYPLIPMGIFKNRDLSLLLVMTVLGFMGFAVSPFWISLYIQRIWQASALKTAVYMLPMAIGGIIVNIIAAVILHRISNKLIMCVGILSYTLSFLLLALTKTSYGYWPMIFPALCLAVVGADFQFNVTNMYVMSSMPKAQQSIASGLFQTLCRLGLTVGMGISTAIYDSSVKSPRAGFHAGDPIQPYSHVFWFATAAAAITLPLIPILKVKTQGNRTKAKSSAAPIVEQATVAAPPMNESLKEVL